MQIDTATNVVVNRTGQTANRFTFILNSKTAQLLADPYANKQEAVIRELCCNAHDSHIAAGHPERQFVVQLPSTFGLTLVVTDFGTGIPPEMMGKIYCEIGGGDKDGSNDFTGGLGFGSKSPFAVAAQFTVESRIDGVCHAYSMFKDEEGLPAFIHVGSTPTEMANGLTVKVPVERNDVDRFTRAAAKILRRFDPMPVIEGNSEFELHPITYVQKQAGWRVRSHSDDYTNGPLACQGNVVYPISADALGDLTPNQAALLSIPLELDFDMGEIQVPISREAISYTPRTVAHLKRRLDEVYDDFIADFKFKFASCKTEYEARLLYFLTFEAKGNSPRLAKLFHNQLQWGEEDINSSEWRHGYFDYEEKQTISRIAPANVSFTALYQYYGRKNSKRLEFDGYTPKLDVYTAGTARFVWDDAPRDGVKNVLKFHFDDIPYACAEGKARSEADWRGSRKIIVFKTPPESFEEVHKYLGNPPYTKLSDLADAPVEEKVKSTYIKRPVAKLMVEGEKTIQRGRWGGRETKTSWSEASVNVSDVTVFVPVTRLEAQGFANISYGDMRERAAKAKLMLREEIVYGIPQTHKNLPKRNPHMSNVYDTIKARLVAWLKVNDAASVSADLDMWAKMKGRWFTEYMEHVVGQQPEIKFRRKKPADSLLRAIKHLSSIPYSPEQIGMIRHLCAIFNIDFEEKPAKYDLEELAKDFNDTYPMISHASHRTSDTQLFNHCLRYIHMIDKF